MAGRRRGACLTWRSQNQTAGQTSPPGLPRGSPLDTLDTGGGARIAAAQRDAELLTGRSFATETVVSHPSKLELIKRAKTAGYGVMLHIVMVPEDLAVTRKKLRAYQGGHSVPEAKVRQRYQRLWRLVAEANAFADEAVVYDNSSARRPFTVVARYRRGEALGEPAWPAWTPDPLSGQPR